MSLKGTKIGFALTGSFFTIKPTIGRLKELVKSGAEIIPIMSFNAYNVNTRFGEATEFIHEIEELTSHKVINTFVEAEMLGNKEKVDILVIAPCTGNTLAKLAHAITDTPVLVAAKACIRNAKSIVIGISTNDGLSNNAENIGKLLNTKNMYFVPFAQDNPITKPYSLAFHAGYIAKTIEYALSNKQVQPILL